MQIDFTLIGIALATMFFGYFFGLLEGRGQGYKRRKKQEAEEKKNLPAPPSAAPVRVDDPGLLRLKDENGQILLDLDGQRVSASGLSADQKKRLIGLLTLMRPWLEGGASAQASSLSGGTGGGAARPPAPQPAPVIQPAARPTPLARLEEEEKTAAPLSIVGQIDSILQLRLMNTPLAGKGIRLQESQQGNVVVWVGVKKYPSVDDVPDEEIKSAIRAAIAEWEEKFTPGI